MTTIVISFLISFAFTYRGFMSIPGIKYLEKMGIKASRITIGKKVIRSPRLKMDVDKLKD